MILPKRWDCWFWYLVCNHVSIWSTVWSIEFGAIWATFVCISEMWTSEIKYINNEQYAAIAEGFLHFPLCLPLAFLMSSDLTNRARSYSPPHACKTITLYYGNHVRYYYFKWCHSVSLTALNICAMINKLVAQWRVIVRDRSI